MTQLMEMLNREPELDRSQPLGPQARALLADVIARCERAEVALRIENLGHDPRAARHKHLQSKGEGIRLAISYMEEELRLSSFFSEGHDGEPDGDHEEAGTSGSGHAAGQAER